MQGSDQQLGAMTTRSSAIFCTLVLGMALTSTCYGQQGGGAFDENTAEMSSPSKTHESIDMKNSDDNQRLITAGPAASMFTDDFGRELSYCLLPVDYVPDEQKPIEELSKPTHPLP